MSTIYLIRHGQAGTRRNYDALSDLGREQARRLGVYLAGQGIRFHAMYSGALMRQQETACEVFRACAEAGLQPPGVVVDPGWNEFDLDRVYETVGPLLREDDAEFRGDHEELLRQMADRDSPVHRRWARCDTSVVRAWVEGRYTCDGESWADFHRRISGRLEALDGHAPDENAAIFTSATPMAIVTGLALDLQPSKVLGMAGVTWNSAITTLRLRNSRLTLYSFNGVPHLADPKLRTLR